MLSGPGGDQAGLTETKDSRNCGGGREPSGEAEAGAGAGRWPSSRASLTVEQRTASIIHPPAAGRGQAGGGGSRMLQTIGPGSPPLSRPQCQVGALAPKTEAQGVASGQLGLGAPWRSCSLGKGTGGQNLWSEASVPNFPVGDCTPQGLFGSTHRGGVGGNILGWSPLLPLPRESSDPGSAFQPIRSRTLPSPGLTGRAAF